MGILDQSVIRMPKEKTMKKFIKKFFGIKEISVAIPEVIKQTPKEIATEKKEPWIAVLDTHINKDNIRNGFFELDWNEYFVLQLRTAGYSGDTDEAIVDAWFSELCRNVGAEENINMDRRLSGYININNLGNGKAEIS